MKPPILPRPSVPKKSPIRFPKADPHAPAGPNSKLKTTGMTLAGRSSVKPGIRGMPLSGIRIAAYTAAVRATRTTILVWRHIVTTSRISPLTLRRFPQSGYFTAKRAKTAKDHHISENSGDPTVQDVPAPLSYAHLSEPEIPGVYLRALRPLRFNCIFCPQSVACGSAWRHGHLRVAPHRDHFTHRPAPSSFPTTAPVGYLHPIGRVKVKRVIVRRKAGGVRGKREPRTIHQGRPPRLRGFALARGGRGRIECHRICARTGSHHARGGDTEGRRESARIRE
jgi:hypothetical protein